MNKKIIWLLVILAIIIFGGLILIFWQQIKAYRSISVTPATKPLINSQLVYIPIDNTDPVFGNPGANLVLVIFADLGCSKCANIYTQMRAFVRAHPNDVKMVWKNVPISGWISDGSEPAHRATYCALQQGKFWEFADMVFASRDNLKNEQLNKIAEGLKLNIPAWTACVNADTTKQKIETDLALAQALGVGNLPGVFANSRLLNIPDDVNFSELLNKFLK